MRPVFRGLEFGQFGFGLLGDHLEPGVDRCINLQSTSIDDVLGKKNGQVAHDRVHGVIFLRARKQDLGKRYRLGTRRLGLSRVIIWSSSILPRT